MNEREGDLIRAGEEPEKVIIVDNGEDFSGSIGSVPNHEKIEIIYISPKD